MSEFKEFIARIIGGGILALLDLAGWVIDNPIGAGAMFLFGMAVGLSRGLCPL